MQAEIITIGDELLIGMTVDTNSAWMGQELTNIGVDVYQISSISDKKAHILKAIDEAFNRSELVLITGGLGPTNDDITKSVLVDYFDSELVIDDNTLEYIKNLLSIRGLKMNENNKQQALVPRKCRVLPNRKGTAPGMLFKQGEKVLVAMPGVPYEMKDIMSNEVIPYIKQNFNKDIIKCRLIMVYGTFEAKLAEILESFEAQLPEGISLAYLPTAGIIKLRLTGRGKDEKYIDNLLEKQIDILKETIPDFIYGFDGELLEEVVGRLLNTNNANISAAESCTGGTVSKMLSSVPGSSAYFKGSVIAYHNDIKISALGVKEHSLENFGAVSREVAMEMADGIRFNYNTNYSVSITGIAGPDGGTEEKPVGTVWIAISSVEKTIAQKFSFGNIREHNMRRASLAALNMLRKIIIKETNKQA